jgi:VanZ family protein
VIPGLPAQSAMRPFSRPAVWLGAWWGLVAVVVVLSLVSPPDLPSTPAGSDKLGHVLAYAALMAGAVQLFARRRHHWRAAGGLVALGVLLEVLQGGLTADRMQDPWDAVANTVGVLAGWLTVATPMRDWLSRFDSRRR